MNVMRIVAGLASGLLFGAGLALAGMTNPSKVLNFLDLTRQWDPSLAFVMAAAIPVSALAFWIGRRRARPLFDVSFVLPGKAHIEPTLLFGSALFGIGWGLAGYCPGPAVASLSQPDQSLIVYLVGLVVGLVMAAVISRRISRRGAERR